MNLPEELVTAIGLPAISCYISETGATWLPIAFIPSTAGVASCGLVGIGTPTPAVAIINGPVGWRYFVIAIF
jgi:hypothetical protein